MEHNPNRQVGFDITFLTLLSLTIIIIGATSIKEKSVTVDEPYYIGLGYYLYKTGNYKIDPLVGHPPISYYVNSIPLYILDLAGYMPDDNLFKINETRTYYHPNYHDQMIRDCFFCYREKYGYKLLYDEAYKKLDLLYYSRISMMILLIIACIYMYLIAKKYYPPNVAAIITLLFSLNPNILAHARLITTDITPVAFNLVSLYYFINFMEKKKVKNAVLAGIGLGLALTSKISSIYLIPVYLIILAFETLRDGKPIKPTIKYCVLILILVIITINTVYGWKGINVDYYKEYKPAEGYYLSHLISKMTLNLPIPVSYFYLNQFEAMDHRMKYVIYQGHLKEQSRMYGSLSFRIEYWLTTIISKTPEGILLLALIGIYYFFIIQGKDNRQTTRVKKLREYLLIHMSIIAIIIVQYDITIGIRIILFILPIIYLILAEVISYLLSTNKNTKKLAYVIVIISIMPTIIYHPHYIPYFNQLIGGPENAYKYFSDSNLDWGQELSGIKRYIDEKKLGQVKMAYYGSGLVDGYDIDYYSLPHNHVEGMAVKKYEKCVPTSGTIIISSAILKGQVCDASCYSWLENFEPISNIGYSIQVYEIDEKDLTMLIE